MSFIELFLKAVVICSSITLYYVGRIWIHIMKWCLIVILQQVNEIVDWGFNFWNIGGQELCLGGHNFFFFFWWLILETQ